MQKNYTENFVQVYSLMGVVIDGRLFLRQFLLQGQRELLSLLGEMVVTTTKRSCKSSPKWLLQMEYRSQLWKH
jgi:hypothetical protein